MSTHLQTASEKALTVKQKRQLDCLLEKLRQYLLTPEGRALSERVENLFARIYNQLKPPQLTIREQRALTFIRNALKHGHPPSVREVGQAVGVRSSRSGLRTTNV